MAKSGNQKGKLLYLAEIFHRETDEAHGLTLAELTERLAAYGVQAERKTLYADMEELRRCGLDIDSWKEGREYRYRLASREFELPELKLLVDAVQASRFITESKSRSLIKKLESLVSVHDARQLQRQVLIAGRVKTMNESIYYNIDKLHSAIGEGKQIRFQYFQWTVEKKEALRRDGGWYCVSPWHLRWDDENYYLIAYDAEADRVKHYRVDKMKRITLLEAPRLGQERMARFDPAVIHPAAVRNVRRSAGAGDAGGGERDGGRAHRPVRQGGAGAAGGRGALSGFRGCSGESPVPGLGGGPWRRPADRVTGAGGAEDAGTGAASGGAVLCAGWGQDICVTVF